MLFNMTYIPDIICIDLIKNSQKDTLWSVFLYEIINVIVLCNQAKGCL